MFQRADNPTGETKELSQKREVISNIKKRLEKRLSQANQPIKIRNLVAYQKYDFKDSKATPAIVEMSEHVDEAQNLIDLHNDFYLHLEALRLYRNQHVDDAAFINEEIDIHNLTHPKLAL